MQPMATQSSGPRSRPSPPRSSRFSSVGNWSSIWSEQGQTEPFDPSIYDNPEDAELERRAELRRSAAYFLLMGRAKEWLLREVP